MSKKVEIKEVVSFLQGKRLIQDDNVEDRIKEKMSEFTNVKNLHFLFGAGVSSGAIPSMKTMNEEIRAKVSSSKKFTSDEKEFLHGLGNTNLEKVLGLLYAQKYYFNGKKEVESDKIPKATVQKLISFIEAELYVRINIDLDDQKSAKSIELYKKFYQKISQRNKDLSRINVFTTNNDLLNEKALDDLNINYNNGFGGGLKRVFNPARFNFTFSRKIDSNMEKFEPLDNMVYLYKLHGSISWVEKNDSYLFNIQEVPVEGGKEKGSGDHVLIYPTPLKQNQSLGAPYSDLIRHFQTNLLKLNSVLIVVGYSFNDEHINNIIYQSLASNSSLSIVILGNYTATCPLTKLEDNRIYQIFTAGSSDNPIHYFERFVNELLPEVDDNKEKKILEGFVRDLAKATQESKKI